MTPRIDPAESPLRLTGAMHVRPLAPPAQVARTDLAARAAETSRLDSFEFTRPVRTTLPAAPAMAPGMVAATVPGRVDFLADSAAPASGALPMYRHPADRNAAATAVDAGRVLDVEG